MKKYNAFLKCGRYPLIEITKWCTDKFGHSCYSGQISIIGTNTGLDLRWEFTFDNEEKYLLFIMNWL